MSFTVKVKEELLNLSRFDKSELSAIIKMSGSLGLTSSGLTLSITTENAKVARHIYELIETIYHVQPEITKRQISVRIVFITFLLLRMSEKF